MKNLQTFDEFINEAKSYDFSDPTQFAAYNPSDRGAIRKSPSYQMKQGKYYDSRFGKSEERKLIDYIFSGIQKKYPNAELLPEDEPHSVFTEKIVFDGHVLKFNPREQEMSWRGFGKKDDPYIKTVIAKVYDRTLVKRQWFDLNKVDSIQYGDLDRLADIFLEEI